MQRKQSTKANIEKKKKKKGKKEATQNNKKKKKRPINGKSKAKHKSILTVSQTSETRSTIRYPFS